MVTLNSAALDLVLHQLYVHFPVPGGLVRAVDGVDICFRHQQITGIIGESGCGKSVLGQAILGILPDYVARSGNIFYRSTDILADNTSLPGFYGQQIALIPQNPGDSLNPLRTIGRQFDDILQTAGLNDKTNQRKQQLLTFFGLPDAERVLAAYPHELSGGMRQRVMIAMAMSSNPKVLIADEPTTALDVTIQAQILHLLLELQKKNNMSIILITHDLGVVAQTCKRVAVMCGGYVVEEGTVEEIFLNPGHPYTQALLSAVPIPDPKAKKDRIILEGNIPSALNPPSGCKFHTRCPKCMERCKTEAPQKYQVGDDHFVYCHLYDTEEAKKNAKAAENAVIHQ